MTLATDIAQIVLAVCAVLGIGMIRAKVSSTVRHPWYKVRTYWHGDIMDELGRMREQVGNATNELTQARNYFESQREERR